MRRLVALVGSLALTVCAAVAGSVQVDFNPKAEFERFKTWDWAPDRDQEQRGVLADETMRGRVEHVLAARLEDAGLRRAAEGETPDLLVRYQGDVGTGKTINTSAGALANWYDPGYVTTQFSEQRASLIVDLIDRSTSVLAWRLYVDEKFGGPNDPPGKLRKAMEKGFAKYPPSESERARKAHELEKRQSAK